MNYPDARRRAIDEQEEDVAIIGAVIATIVIIFIVMAFFITNSSNHSRPAQKPKTQTTTSQSISTPHTSMSINPGGPVRGLKTHP